MRYVSNYFESFLYLFFKKNTNLNSSSSNLKKYGYEILLPINTSEIDFIEETKDISEVYPIWLCPIKTFKESKTIFSLPSDGKIYVDVGIYGSWENP